MLVLHTGQSNRHSLIQAIERVGEWGHEATPRNEVTESQKNVSRALGMYVLLSKTSKTRHVPRIVIRKPGKPQRGIHPCAIFAKDNRIVVVQGEKA